LPTFENSTVDRKPTGNAGKGLYELKPEFYCEYSPYFCHYARTEQVKVSDLQKIILMPICFVDFLACWSSYSIFSQLLAYLKP